MRKLIRRIGLLLCLAAIVPSCELLEDCKSCTAVFVSSGGDRTEGATATYCGTQLAAKEIETVETALGTSFYECQ